MSNDQHSGSCKLIVISEEEPFIFLLHKSRESCLFMLLRSDIG